MPKGNPNPDTSGLKPFEPGQSGNPGGKTSEQRKAEIENAEKATLIRGRLLDAVIEATNDAKDKEALAFIEAGMLKLLKDAEDRGFGTAVQSVNIESPNGTMSPKPAIDATKLKSETLEDILNAATDES